MDNPIVTAPGVFETHKTAIIVGGICIVLAIAGGIAYYMHTQKGDKGKKGGPAIAGGAGTFGLASSGPKLSAEEAKKAEVHAATHRPGVDQDQA